MKNRQHEQNHHTYTRFFRVSSKYFDVVFQQSNFPQIGARDHIDIYIYSSRLKTCWPALFQNKVTTTFTISSITITGRDYFFDTIHFRYAILMLRNNNKTRNLNLEDFSARARRNTDPREAYNSFCGCRRSPCRITDFFLLRDHRALYTWLTRPCLMAWHPRARFASIVTGRGWGVGIFSHRST